MTVTQWFQNINPAYCGVYQRRLYEGVTYSYWNGKHWLYAGWSVDEAIRSVQLSCTQDADWRGLAK